MKNFLYITYVDYQENSFPGVQAKINGQIGALRAAGHHVDRINQFGSGAQLVDCDNSRCELFTAPLSRRFSILKAVKAAVSRRKYAGAYIRFQFFSEDMRRITRLLRKNGTKVILEIPTYPYDSELRQQGPKGEVKLLCDRLFRRSCGKNIDLIATFSDDKRIYGVPCMTIMNGLDYDLFPLREVRQPREDVLHLLVVASMQPWQGYDRLLKGMVDYYRQDRPVRVVAHLVGDGVELAGYQKIAAENGIEQYVRFYGQKDRESIRQIANQCDIAVGSLGSFRRPGVTRLSTLKSREYCALGFPSVNATQTDILDRDNPYCLYVPEDESAVDIEQVVDFYHRVYFKSGLTASQVAETVRQEAMRVSDSRVVFRCVIDYFENTAHNGGV